MKREDKMRWEVSPPDFFLKEGRSSVHRLLLRQPRRGQASRQGSTKGKELELDIPFQRLQTIQILDKLIHGQKSFSRMHAPHLVDPKPSRDSMTSTVRSSQCTVLQTTSSPSFFLRDSRAYETRARVKITTREKTRSVSPFLARGDFHARSRFARSTIPEEKWGTNHR